MTSLTARSTALAACAALTLLAGCTSTAPQASAPGAPGPVTVAARGIDPADAIQHTGTEGLDVIPANIDLSAAEVHLVTEVAREQILASVLRRVAADYDVILIDCQPSLGLLTVNALTAAHGVIIPLETEFFALRGVALLVETIEKVQDRLNPGLEIDGILATMYDGRTNHARAVLDTISETYDLEVIEPPIPKTIKFAEAPAAGRSILATSRSSKGAHAYREATEALVARSKRPKARKKKAGKAS